MEKKPYNLPEMPPMPPDGYGAEALRGLFAGDRVAVNLGMEIEHVANGGARCSMLAGPQHLNALGVVQGGAIYALADYAFSVAAASGHPGTVTLSGDMHYLKPLAQGRVMAHAEAVSNTRRTCVYRVEVFGDNGVLSAVGTFTGYKR